MDVMSCLISPVCCISSLHEITHGLYIFLYFLQDTSMNITECCVREKVSEGCMDACSFFLDIESVMDKPQCLPDFDKLMKCSAGKK